MAYGYPAITRMERLQEAVEKMYEREDNRAAMERFAEHQKGSPAVPPQDMPKTGVHDIVSRLRNYDGCHDGDIDEAADMLEFFFDQMQAHSLKMNGQHGYRFRSGGWPMTHCVGPNAEEAVRAAIRETKRSSGDESHRGD